MPEKRKMCYSVSKWAELKILKDTQGYSKIQRLYGVLFCWVKMMLAEAAYCAENELLKNMYSGGNCHCPADEEEGTLESRSTREHGCYSWCARGGATGHRGY